MGDVCDNLVPGAEKEGPYTRTDKIKPGSGVEWGERSGLITV